MKEWLLLYAMIGICTTALAVAFGIGVVIGWVIWGLNP